MALRIRNNARSALSVSISATANILSVTAGHGARFPAVPAGDWYPVAIEDASGNIEYVRVTGRTGDVLTILRGQGGTQPRAFSSGAAVELRMTVEAYGVMVQSGATGPSGVITIDDTVVFT